MEGDVGVVLCNPDALEELCLRNNRTHAGNLISYSSR